MAELVCWCCEHYLPSKTFLGYCSFKEESRGCESPICRNFVKRSGLYTTRTYPKDFPPDE